MARPPRLVALDVSDELGGLVVELLLRVRGPAAADLDAFADSLLGPGTVAVGLFDLETSRLAGLVAALTDERSLALVVELVAERGLNRLAIEQRLMHELLARPELANISDIELLTDPDLTTLFRQFGFRPSSGGYVLLRRSRPLPVGAILGVD